MSLFHETQRFRQPWLFAIIGAIVVGAWLAFIQQIVRGKPFGNDPAPDWAVVMMTALLGVGLPAATSWLQMETEVYPDRVEIHMKPLSNRVIPSGEIAGVAARTYRPIREYGGWGIRGIGSNRAYNTSGDQGVQLVLTNGNRILIGTQQPDALAAAISQIAGR